MDNKKIIVIGCPGVGKTHFSKNLSNILGIKVYHLDDFYWEKDWKEKNDKEWIKIQEKLLENNQFIIDGNFINSLELRIESSDLIIYLKKGTIFCILGFLKRTLKNAIGKDIDIPKKIKEQNVYRLTDNGIINFCFYIMNFQKNQSKEIDLILSKYYNSKNIIILKSKRDINNFLRIQKNERI